MSRNRDMEWMLATLLIAFGGAVIYLPNVFLTPIFAQVFGRGIDEDPFGAFLVAVGIVWMVGLRINGHWPGGTPYIRLGCAILGAASWGATWGAVLSMGFTTGVATYGVVGGFSVLACARCGADVAKLRLAKKARQGD